MQIYKQYVKFLFVNFNMWFHGITACDTLAITENATLRVITICKTLILQNTTSSVTRPFENCYKITSYLTKCDPSINGDDTVMRLGDWSYICFILLYFLSFFSFLIWINFRCNFSYSPPKQQLAEFLSENTIWRDLLYCSEIKEMWLLVVQFSELCLAKNASRIWTPTSAPSKSEIQRRHRTRPD